MPLNKLTMYIVPEFIVILIIVCIASTTRVTSGAPIQYEMFLHFPQNASINIVIDLNANDDSTDSDIQDILIAMGYENNENMKQYLKKEFKKRKDTLIEKRGPLNQSIDTSIKKPLFILEILLTTKTTYNLFFFEDDSIDYAYRRFLYNLKDDEKNIIVNNKASRAAILKSIHQELIQSNENICNNSLLSVSEQQRRQCHVNQCKKQLPYFPGYENRKPASDEWTIQYLNSLALQNKITTCIETGTYYGNTTIALAKAGYCKEVVTIELSKELSTLAKVKFSKEIENGNIDKESRIVLIQGDSAAVFQTNEYFQNENDKFKKALWFLDGHYSAGVTARGKKDSPIIEELKYILDPHRINYHKSEMDIIVIDDARQFHGGRFSTGEVYPEMQEILELICELDPKNIFIDLQDDMILLIRKRESDYDSL